MKVNEKAKAKRRRLALQVLEFYREFKGKVSEVLEVDKKKQEIFHKNFKSKFVDLVKKFVLVSSITTSKETRKFTLKQLSYMKTKI